MRDRTPRVFVFRPRDARDRSRARPRRFEQGTAVAPPGSMTRLPALVWFTACALLATATLPAQRPASPNAVDLELVDALRSGAAGVGDRLKDVADDARRARLQAALEPLEHRPLALLQVAQAFPDSPEADRALLAASAALIQVRGRTEALPELEVWLGYEEERGSHHGSQPLDARQTYTELLAEIDSRRRHADADPALLGWARELLDLLRLTHADLDPIRIRAADSWLLPGPRREDLLLSWTPTPPGDLDALDLTALPAPEHSLLVPRDRHPLRVDAPPPGRWLITWTSPETRCRSARAVEIGDLEAVALIGTDRLALLALRDGEPTEVRAAVRDGREPFEASWVDGTEVLELPDRGVLDLDLESADGHATTLHLYPPWRRSVDREPWRSHLMVDRPLYRPGETIRGRILLQGLQWHDVDQDVKVTTRRCAEQTIILRAFHDTDHAQTLELQLDERGVAGFEVAIPADFAPGEVRFRGRIATEKHDDLVLDSTPAQVASFVRPAISLRCEGPNEYAADDRGEFEVTLRANWASGGPAAGLQVDAVAWNGYRSERRQLRTGPHGRATLPITSDGLLGREVHTTFTVVGPDGREQTARHSVRPVPEPRPVSRGGLRITAPDALVVDERTTIELQGPAHGWLLLVRGRGEGATAESVRLDAEGRANIQVIAGADDWPVLDLAIADGGGRVHRRVPIRMAAQRRPTLELPERCAPGAKIEFVVDAGAPDALVTIAVVDERIFALRRDRTPTPRDALVPEVPSPSWRHEATGGWHDPLRALAELLSDGRVPPFDPDWSRGIASPGPSGGATATGVGAAEMREEFRATAAFETLISGRDGLVRTSLVMPDDLTTWRVTVVGVHPDGDGFVLRRPLTTRKPLAAEPLLPRVLRAGDRVDLPVLIDRGADDGLAGDERVRFATTSSADEVLRITHDAARVEVPAASARTVHVSLAAERAGAAELTTAVSSGDRSDRSRRTLTIAPDAFDSPVYRAATGRAPLRIEAPEGAVPGSGLQLVVSADDAALRRRWRARLECYPYGCVEQTLSGLLPFFAELRAAELHGLPLPTRDQGFRDRLARGLARLRALQAGTGGGFRWWPGDREADAEMTALVLHGLCVLRDAGLDPDTQGLRCDLDREPFAGAIERTAAGIGDDFDDHELAAAALRRHPGASTARAAVVALLASGRRMTPGLAAGCGLALLAAGDRERAARCLELARQPSRPDLPHGILTEAPITVAARRLELAFGLAPDADHRKAADALARAVIEGRPSTHALATALTAHALVVPPTANGESIAIRVVAGPDPAARRLELTAADGFLAELQLPFAPTLTLETPSRTRLRVQLRGELLEPASTHVADAGLVRIERAFVDEQDEPPNTLRAGQPVALRLELTSEERLDYAVVVCPLPAGFELPVEPVWIQRFDDHVAFTLRQLPADRRTVRKLTVVPTMSGEVLWPPVRVESMYVAGRGGSSAGGFVTIEAAADDSSAPQRAAPCFLPRVAVERAAPEPRPPTLREQLAELATSCSDAWYADVSGCEFYADDPAAATPAESEFAVSLQRFASLVGSAPRSGLEELVELREWLPYRDRQGALRNTWGGHRRVLGTALDAWRTKALDRLDGLCTAVLETLLVDIETRSRRGLAPDPVAIDAVLEAFELDGLRIDRPAVLARLLTAAIPFPRLPIDDILDTIEPPVTDPELRGALHRALGRRSAWERDEVFDLLPRSDRIALPPATLLAIDSDWERSSALDALLATEDGRRELRRRWHDPEFVAEHASWFGELVDREPWHTPPLAVFRHLDLWPHERGERIARSAIADAELQRALVAAEDDDWRRSLAEALHIRGVAGLGAALGPDDPLGSAWHAVLAAAVTDDATRLEELLLAGWNDDDGEFPIDLELDEFLQQRLAERAPVDCLLRVAAVLDRHPRQTAVGRLTSAEMITLLEGSTPPHGFTRPPHTTAEAHAMLGYAERAFQAECRADAERALNELCHTELGLAALRGAIEALDEDFAALAQTVLDEAPPVFGDPDEPPTTPAIQRAMQRLQWFGPRCHLRADEQRALERALLLRGLR
jgi:hypothetical protein